MSWQNPQQRLKAWPNPNQIPRELMREAQLQAEFYHHAKLIGLPCLLEFVTPIGRLDIAILDRELKGICAIIECKLNRRQKVRHSWQIERYKQIGVPVYGLADFDRAARLARQLKYEFYDNPVAKVVLFNEIAEMFLRHYGKKRVPIGEQKVIQPPFSPLNLDPDINFKDS